jgi:hypothetical protein
MRLLRPRGSALAVLALLAGVTTSDISRAAETSLAIEVQDLLQLPVDQRRRLLRGEIVSYPVTENGEREIAVGLAMLVQAPVTQVAQYVASGQLVALDPSIGESGVLPGELPPGSLVGPGFSSGEREEAQNLLEATPGTRFNLSLAEIEALRAARASAANSSRGGAVEIASDTYRRLLGLRVQSYRQAGLAGIAPYARAGGAVTDPAIDLRAAVHDVERVGRAGSEFREALQRYPTDQPPQLTSQVSWIKRRVQRRPHLSLLHRMIATGEGPTIHLERYFYVEHSFNSMETLTWAVAYEDATMVFSTTRVSTDEVLGVGSQLKRSVGRGQVRDEMRARLERLRSAYAARPVVTTESP